MTAAQQPEEDRLDRVERILAETVAGLAEVRTIQAESAAAHSEEMAEIRSIVADIGKRVDQLTEQQQLTSQDLSVIKGWQTELAVERTAFAVFNRLSHFGTLMNMIQKHDINNYTVAGVRNKIISQEDADRVNAIDFVMEGIDGSGDPVMFAIEVSYTAGYDDVRRAVERAPLIKRLMGREVVIPAVVAEIISQDFEAHAGMNKIRWTYVANGNRISQ